MEKDIQKPKCFINLQAVISDDQWNTLSKNSEDADIVFLDNICVISEEDLKTIEELNKDFFAVKESGYIYLLEMGNKLKIGRSKCPSRRIHELKRQAIYGERELGRIALVTLHKNYVQTETSIHRKLKSHRIKNTELFDISFDAAVMKVEEMINDGEVKIDHWSQKEWNDHLEHEKRSVEILCKSLFGNCPTIPLAEKFPDLDQSAPFSQKKNK